VVLTFSEHNVQTVGVVGAGPVPASEPLPTLAAALHPEAAVGITSSMPLGPDTSPQANPFPTWRFYAGMGMGLAGLAAVAVGGYYGRQVSLLNRERDALAEKANQAAVGGGEGTAYEDYGRYARDVADVNARGAAAERTQKIAYGAGGALVAVGAGLLLWDVFRSVNPEPDAPPVSLVPVLTPTTTGLMLNVGF
jgi:hypothetical protein